MTPIRAVVHCRQSDTRGEGADSLSLESQEAELRARCAREGWAVVRVVKEADLRGWQDESSRPDLEACLRLADEGGYDVHLVWKLDRLARSVRLQEDWVWRLARRGVEVVSHTEAHVRSAPMIRQILGAVAEERTREISGHVRRALHQRARAGLSNGRIPWGYLRPDKDKPLVPDPARAPVVRLLYELTAAGWSGHHVAVELTRRGIPSPTGLSGWREATVRKMVRNPAYRGAVSFGGTLLEEAHPPLVPLPVWVAANDRLPSGRIRAPRADPADCWFAGRLVHACGAPMYVFARNRVGNPYARCATDLQRAHEYPERCPIRPVSVVVSALDRLGWQAVEHALSRLVDPDEVMRRAARELRQAGSGAVEARIAAERRTVAARTDRNRAEAAYLAGLNDLAWYAEKARRADTELAAAAADLAALPGLPDPAEVAARHAELLAIGGALGGVLPEERRAILARLGVLRVESRGKPARYPDNARVVLVPRSEFAPLLTPG